MIGFCSVPVALILAPLSTIRAETVPCFPLTKVPGWIVKVTPEQHQLARQVPKLCHLSM